MEREAIVTSRPAEKILSVSGSGSDPLALSQMKLYSFVTATATLLSTAWPACALPAAPESILSSAPLSKANEPLSARSRPVPIVVRTRSFFYSVMYPLGSSA